MSAFGAELKKLILILSTTAIGINTVEKGIKAIGKKIEVLKKIYNRKFYNLFKMKKITGILACFAVAILISSCNDASKKDMSDASQKIKEVNTDMKQAIIATNDSAKAAAISNWKTFKNESDSAVVAMEREATKLDEKIAKANTKEKEKLKAYLNNTKEKLHALKIKLQQRNIEFENNKEKFDIIIASKNQSFEREFKHDINELGTAFKDLFNDNVK